MQRFFKICAISCFSVFLLGSCKTRRVLEESPLINLPSNVILQQIEGNKFEFNSLNGKLSASVDSKDLNGSFKINLRVKKDSVIWMSLTPALGIEAVRAIITPDSLQYINKLKKESFAGNFTAIDTVLYYHTGYKFIENLLVGNAVDIQPDEKYSATVEGLYYVIQTRAKRKVKKALDVSLKKSGNDTLTFSNQKDLDKATDKLGTEDLILKRYFVRPDDFRVVKAYIDDLLYQRTFRIEYDDFIDVDGTAFPQLISILVSTPNESAKFELRYSRIKIDEAQTYPFKIPSSYSPIR